MTVREYADYAELTRAGVHYRIDNGLVEFEPNTKYDPIKILVVFCSCESEKGSSLDVNGRLFCTECGEHKKTK